MSAAHKEERQSFDVLPLADLDARIASLEAELAQLHERRIERDHAALLLAILQITDSWFQVHELIAAAVLSPELSRWLAGKSPKSVGKLLRAIADAQDAFALRSGNANSLRLLRHARTIGGALWKVEIHALSCEAPGLGR